MKDQLPPASAVVVPSVVAPSVKVTTVLAAPVPLSAGFEVILSLDDEPVSLERAAVTVGATVSSVNVSDAMPVLPALSVSLATMVWAPCASPTGV